MKEECNTKQHVRDEGTGGESGDLRERDEELRIIEEIVFK